MTTRAIARSTTADNTTSLRTARSAAVALTVGAAAFAATVVAATPAHAAAPSYYRVWERVAECESSNNWHINTGNGYYGGVQFSSSTWGAYGGHKYASEANLASKAEQIQVARRVLDSQGPGAWPVCGPNAGLTRGTGAATSAPLPSDAAGAASATRHHARKAAKAKHAKQVRHAKHAKHYRVRSGDTLSKIAHAKHVEGGWRALFRANRSKLSNPNHIRVGQLLRIP